MAISSSGAPFQRGKTFYGGRTIDTANYEGVQLEGQVVKFASMQAPDGSPVQPQYDGSDVTAVIVRNTSGSALLPKRLVSWASGSTKRVDSYVQTVATQVAGVVDPQLPSTGVPNGDLFYLIIEDPNCLVTTQIASLPTSIAAGDVLYAATGSTTSATTSGRVVGWNTAMTATSTQSTDGTMSNVLLNRIGRAKSARTTNQTASDILIDLQIRK